MDDALAVGEVLSTPFAVGKAAAKCCGYPLYAAGDLEGFVRHATRFAEMLQQYPELVVVDPGCAYTLKVVYPRMGVALGGTVRTVYEVLAERLDHAPSRPKLPFTAAYHDACHLGRGLGQYEPPRALLAAAVTSVGEAREAREEAGCAGGGGLLPRTMPDTAVEVARAQGERLAEAGTVVVTACPTSRRMFARAGKPAEDLLAVLRRWLVPAAPTESDERGRG